MNFYPLFLSLFRITRQRFVALAQEVVEIFPGEVHATYYSSAEGGQKASGKLFEHYSYTLKKLRDQGHLVRKGRTDVATEPVAVISASDEGNLQLFFYFLSY